MKVRSGATLVEVLVAIFILAIGLLALLTLFPIGILTMRQAILDDRSAHAAANAVAIAETQSIRQDPYLLTNRFYVSPNPNPGPGEATLMDLAKGLPNSVPPVPAAPDSPSYTLYVDPIGVRSYVSPYDVWVGGQSNGIARRSVSFINNIAVPQQQNLAIWKWFSSLDDVIFGLDGQPAPTSPGANVYERGSIYSCGYLLRRRAAGTRAVVDMTVVVYQQRPLTLKNGIQPGESVYNATFDPTSSIVTVSWTPPQPPPNLVIGGWILDSSPVQVIMQDAQNPNDVYGPSHARFYRVVSITQTDATTADLEVATQFQDFPIPVPRNAPAGAQPSYSGYIVVMDNVVEVFPVGTGRRP